MKRSQRWLSAVLTLCTCSAAYALEREINWVPSGAIAVGDRTSEAASKYDGYGEIQTLSLAYKGEQPQTLTGRLVAQERFVIRPSSYRGGPAPANLVICRRVDTGALPGPLTVKIGEKELGTWTITAPAGDRRLFDAVFVIPKAAFMEKEPVPGEVLVTITGAKPAVSLGYRFFTARDWDILGAELADDVAAGAAKATGGKADCIAGVLAEADHDWTAALAAYTKAAGDADKELARLARVGERRAELRVARAAALAKDPTGEGARPNFDAHYTLGVLAGAWGCWEDALTEMKLATLANPTHADATYRLAEAMEFNRLPIAEWAPLCERAGFLAESDAVKRGGAPANVEDVLVAIHTEAVPNVCGVFSQNSMTELQRDWRYVEQQVYGASRGAWKMRTHYVIYGPGSHPWGKYGIFMPTEEDIPVWGTYDYSVGTAEFGASGASGPDCGPSGCGAGEIGPTRGWEVLLHEWNHEFDWVGIFAEQLVGYAPTHDSDNCGKQPIVSMGCGHRASMRYYINRAQYLRHEASDLIIPEAVVGDWLLSPIVPGPTPDLSPEALATWLVDNKHLTAERVKQVRAEWEGQKKAEAEQAGKPVAVYPPPNPPVPDWPAFLRQQWYNVRLLDTLAAPDEAQFAPGGAMTGTWKPITAENGFVDLKKVVPDAPEKCVVYARTFVYSPVDQEVRIWLGFNPHAAMWLNGRKIQRGVYYACANWDDFNHPYELAQSGKLVKGWNCLTYKLERAGRNWGFSAHIVDFDNQAIPGLKIATQLPAGEQVARYVAPEVGKRYKWAEVKDDFIELLPRLSAAELAKITGVAGLGIGEHRFFLTLPKGAEPAKGSRYIAEMSDQDVELNNYLNWDCEAAAALRYTKDGKTHDLIIVRPEYYEEFVSLLSEPAAGKPATPASERVLGYIDIMECQYGSTGGGPRVVLVLDATLGDYPADDVDLLALP